MQDKYMLEIYSPAGRDNVMAYFTSDTPFQAISQGDVINRTTLPQAEVEGDRADDLMVSSVEHILWNDPDSQSKHKVCVYTQHRNAGA
jgi:hypothetical protein